MVVPRFSAEDRRALRLLLTPSWLSGLVAITVGLVLSAGIIGAFDLHNSGLQQQLVAWQQTQPQPALTVAGQTLNASPHPSFSDSWSLVLVWGVVGLLVYCLVAIILHDFTRAEEFKRSLNYVNARPDSQLAATAERLVLRFIATVLLIVWALLCLREIVPYSITAAHASAADLLSLDGALYALLAFAITAISAHIMTMLLRLSLGRARVFSDGLPT